MGNRITKIRVLLAVAVILCSSSLLAKEKAKAKTKNAKPVAAKKKAPIAAKKSRPVKQVKPTYEMVKRSLTPDQRLDELKRRYRTGEISNTKLWEELAELDSSNRLSKGKEKSLVQLQASLLYDSKNSLLAAMYAAESLNGVSNPMTSEFTRSWTILSDVSKTNPIQLVLENLAVDINTGNTAPPAFGANWFYFEGLTLESKGNHDAALQSFRKLRVVDRYFLPAKYQSAMIYLAKGDNQTGETFLRSMLDSSSQTLTTLSGKELASINNYAKIALARLYYQQRKFKESVLFFRAVDRGSPLFYDALFEQSWAFFMAGYPNHALGALHGVESPFFEHNFNPEASILRALVYYWMCRYEDSRQALADFTSRHAEAVEALAGFLDRKQLRDETAYELFENVITGVSSSALGIPREILTSSAEQESMMLWRDQFAAVIAEINRLENGGVFGTMKGTKKATDMLRAESKLLQKRIGAQFVTELRGMKDHFDNLYQQSQFLYVELLMSEKEQLLGRELHASAKLDQVSRKKDISAWGSGNQSWNASNLKNEYWWDEVGYYIYDIQPMCQKR
jgi:tetratricopeptide (TPR) repeat protein